ncbi:MAG: glutamine synthetase family protein [Candidatus Hodarchaeales archaeon]|jgi:glutamine synthetase
MSEVTNSEMEISEVTKLIQQEKVKEIVLQFVDIPGILHSLWIPSEYLPKVTEDGIHTDGSSLGVVDVSWSDIKLVPDLNSFVVLPKTILPQGVARVVCDLFEPESNKPFELDPRFIIKKLLNKFKTTLGSSVNGYAASEIEYWVFDRDDNGDIKLLDESGYLATPPADRGAELRLEIAATLRKTGIFVEKHHHEVPPGKYEFNLTYSQALKMIDTIYLVKFIIKMIAAKRGLIASFMPKPFFKQYGCGLHTHINLVDDEKKKNLFYDPDGNYGLSELGLRFIAGVLTHAKALAGITNPSVNSYKRLVPGWEAPVNISWAIYNRSTLVRIPPGKGKGTRMEYRPTDGSCNFYIAYAGLFAAGLDGIQRKLEAPAPIEENIYAMSEQERVEREIKVLPENLGYALKELSKDSYLIKALGPDFIERYLEMKYKEWKDFSVYVHEWERKRYLDV